MTLESLGVHLTAPIWTQFREPFQRAVEQTTEIDDYIVNKAAIIGNLTAYGATGAMIGWGLDMVVYGAIIGGTGRLVAAVWEATRENKTIAETLDRRNGSYPGWVIEGIYKTTRFVL